MESILEKIEKLEQEHDKPDPALLAKHNIKLGLRNSDGSGVVVGLTSKGTVIGYKKLPKGSANPEPSVLNNIHIPGLPADAHITPALAAYYLIKGQVPDEASLKKFESKLLELQEYEITPVDGILYYCGYDVRKIIESIESEDRFGFDEITYLLLTGELPSSKDLRSFSAELARRRSLPEEAQRRIMTESANHDQMSALHRSVSGMSMFDSNPNPNSIRDITVQCIDLIAKVPTIVAYNYQALAFTQGIGRGLVPPLPELGTAENFLYLLQGQIPTRKLAKLMDLCLILHAEHGGGNNSTFTVRVVSSSKANTYMALTSGIASLSGHLHGGANEAVMKMMRGVKDSVEDWSDEEEIESYLRKIINKQAGDKSGKIYGIGHAVYTLSDPRAIILEKKALELAIEVGRVEEFELYRNVGSIGPRLVQGDKGKRVAPNVDFYSGFVYEAMGIPIEIFTPIFSMARMAGWSAHRLEQLIQQKLIRPAYASSFDKERPYSSLAQR
jgi:citrate synthase